MLQDRNTHLILEMCYSTNCARNWQSRWHITGLDGWTGTFCKTLPRLLLSVAYRQAYLGVQQLIIVQSSYHNVVAISITSTGFLVSKNFRSVGMLISDCTWNARRFRHQGPLTFESLNNLDMSRKIRQWQAPATCLTPRSAIGAE